MPTPSVPDAHWPAELLRIETRPDSCERAQAPMRFFLSSQERSIVVPWPSVQTFAAPAAKEEGRGTPGHKPQAPQPSPARGWRGSAVGRPPTDAMLQRYACRVDRGSGASVSLVFVVVVVVQPDRHEHLMREVSVCCDIEYTVPPPLLPLCRLPLYSHTLPIPNAPVFPTSSPQGPVSPVSTFTHTHPRHPSSSSKISPSPTCSMRSDT